MGKNERWKAVAEAEAEAEAEAGAEAIALDYQWVSVFWEVVVFKVIS